MCSTRPWLIFTKSPKKTVLLLTNLSSDDDCVQGWFRAKASSPLTQRAQQYLTIPPGFVGLWSLCKYHIHIDEVRALFLNVSVFIFCIYFFLFSKICGGWVGNEISASDLDRKYICYPAISDFPTYADAPKRFYH